MSITVNGINVAVRDLEDATRVFEQVFGIEGVHLDADSFAFPGLEGTRFDLGGFILILVTSTEPDTSISRFLEKRGDGFFLFSVKVDDIDQSVAHLESQGIPTLLSESARGGFGAVNFVHPRNFYGVQLELIEPPESAARLVPESVN